MLMSRSKGIQNGIWPSPAMSFFLCLLTLAHGLEIHYPEWAVQGQAGLDMTSEGDSEVLLQQMKQLSRSQDGEDVYLFLNFFCGVTGGKFLEIGAYDGLLLSNTLAFEQALGWRGVLIEANPDSFRSLVSQRPLAVRANAAICHRPRQVHWVNAKNVGGIWEFMARGFRQKWHPSLDIADPKATAVIPCYPLSALLAFSGVQHFNFFSLDVEGAELEVLKSLVFKQVTFDIILVEADEHNTTKTAAIRSFLHEHRYQYLGTTLRSDWFRRRGFLPSPCTKFP